jgi:hypothetical protein
MSLQNISDVDLYFRLFDLPNEAGGYHAPEWPLYRCDETIRLVKEKAASYGILPSISGYIRAFIALKAEAVIKPVRSADPFKVAEPVVTKEIYERMSASEVRLRYAQDAEFRAGCDALIARGEI